MRISVVPELINAVVAHATTALDDVDLGGGEYATVYDGLGNSDDPGAYLMVGVDDEDPGSSARAAETEQDWAHATSRQRKETGDLTCVAFAWNGGGSDDAQRICREHVYAIASVVDDLCRGQDLSQDVPGVWSFLVGSVTRLTEYLSEGGERMAFLVFQIHFEARI